MHKKYRRVNQHVCEERDGEKHFCGPNRNIRFWVNSFNHFEKA